MSNPLNQPVLQDDSRRDGCDVGAIIDALEVPLLERLVPAATRLQPLSTAALAELDVAIGLQLAQHIAALRRDLAALQSAAAAEQAVWSAIDLPLALRHDVQAARGPAAAGEAA